MAERNQKEEPEGFGILVGLFIVLIVCWYVLVLLAMPTDAQEKLLKLSGKNAERVLLKEACTWKPICEKFGQARMQCAPAGDFDNCVAVLMEKEPFGYIWSCNTDGTPSAFPKDILPSKTQCFALELKNKLGQV